MKRLLQRITEPDDLYSKYILKKVDEILYPHEEGKIRSFVACKISDDWPLETIWDKWINAIAATEKQKQD